MIVTDLAEKTGALLVLCHTRALGEMPQLARMLRQGGQSFGKAAHIPEGAAGAGAGAGS